LSNKYVVFNDVNTKQGNFDHLVVGPTGLFAIETKNWRGVVNADANGGLKRNGTSTVDVRSFIRRTMTLRDQIIALTHSNGLYVRAVMVFPKARVDARFGDTGKVHCIRFDQLRDYESASFFVGESAIVGEIFFPRSLVSGNNRVVKLLGAPDEVGFRDRRLGGTKENCEQKTEDSRGEFHLEDSKEKYGRHD
jgi:hypothetical protein